ncbi:MAG: CRISPR-associated endonuclease Cas2 [Anaerolineaceae bacterium]
MMILVTYDVNTETKAGKKRLKKVAKECQNFGQRVQNSVFECLVEPAQFRQLQNRISDLIDKEKDSIRYYNLGNEWKNRVEHIGAKETINIEAPLIV